MLRHAPVFVSIAVPALAQCGLHWETANVFPGPDGAVHAMVHWDPDGAGPRGELLVVGGIFSHVGAVAANNVALYDPASATWCALGDGLNGQSVRVEALAVLANGDLVAGGLFTQSAGIGLGPVARWDGSSWQPLGYLPNSGNPVYSLAALPNGDLVAGGGFDSGIARWDGVSWQILGGGANTQVDTVALWNGDIIAGGWFTAIGGVAAAGIARWDGANWHPLGNAGGYRVRALAVAPSGELLAGGSWAFVSQWDGATWNSVGSMPAGSGVYTLAVLNNGDVVAGGHFGGEDANIARWDGVSWKPLDQGVSGVVYALLQDSGGELLVGGFFEHAGEHRISYLARWSDRWMEFGPGINGAIVAADVLPNGNKVVVGDFGSGKGADGVAIWDGASFSLLETGIRRVVQMWSVAVLPNQAIVVGGLFSLGSDSISSRIVCFEHGGGHELLQGATAFAMRVLPNGDLLVGGYIPVGGQMMHLARWDGMSWQPFGGDVDGAVNAIEVLANGDVVVGGFFQSAGGQAARNIALWHGGSWLPLGSGIATTMFLSSINVIKQLRDGSLVVGGQFYEAGGVAVACLARWDGVSWASLGTGGPGGANFTRVHAMALLANGDLVVGGQMALVPYPPQIGRWNGTSWSTFGSGVQMVMYGTPSAGSSVRTLIPLANGGIAVGGQFMEAGGSVSPYLATLMPDCQALVTEYGPLCAGTGGLNRLQATTLPWLGTTFRSRTTGLAPLSLAVAVWAFQQTSLPRVRVCIRANHAAFARVVHMGSQRPDLRKVRRSSTC